jgi:YesN/AraC family two-component response regulator
MSVMAMKAGAVDFLSKPFRQQEMLDAVTVAIERDRKRRKDEKIVSNARALFETLTPREREVLSLVAAGLMNKSRSNCFLSLATLPSKDGEPQVHAHAVIGKRDGTAHGDTCWKLAEERIRSRGRYHADQAVTIDGTVRA